MKLNLNERFAVLQIIPQEGNFATLKIVNDLKLVLAPSETEHKEFEITQDSEMLKWNLKGNEEREIKMGEKATDLIAEALKKLDEDAKLTQNQFTIYEKFNGRD